MKNKAELIAEQLSLSAGSKNNWTIAENFNNLISSLSKRLQNGEVTKIKLVGHSVVEGLGALGHNVPGGNPIIFYDGVNIYREGDYTCRCWANYFREYVGANFPTVSFVNAGIAGKTVEWGLANAKYWIDNNEDVVFVMLASNDRITSNLSAFKSNTEKFLKYVHDRSETMIVLTENPATDDYDEAGVAYRNFSTDAIDRVLTQICIDNKYSHISFYREMNQYITETNDKHLMEYYQSAHPNDAGHLVMWNILQNKLGLGDKFYKVRRLANRKIFNAVIDGNFQIAQANPVIGLEVVNPAFDTYPVFDMWKITGFVGGGDSLPTIKHSQRRITDAGSPINSVTGARRSYFLDVNGAGVTANSQYNIVQRIENGVSQLAPHGPYINISLWMRSSMANKKIQISAGYNYGTGGSPSSMDFLSGVELTLSSTWREYHVSLPNISLSGKTFGANNDDYLELQIKLAGSFQNFVSAGVIELSGVRLNLFGSTPAEINETFEDALKACQRYFEKSFAYSSAAVQNAGTTGALIYMKSIAGAQTTGVYVQFKAKKRFIPNLAFFNPSAANNKWRNATLNIDSGVAASAYPGDTGFLAYNPGLSSDTGTADILAVHWTADCRL